MLVELIELLKAHNKTSYIPELLLIVIKSQISQITYLCRGTQKLNTNVDPSIEKAVASVKGGYGYARDVLTQLGEIKVLADIEVIVNKALISAQKILAMEKPPVRQVPRRPWRKGGNKSGVQIT